MDEKNQSEADYKKVLAENGVDLPEEETPEKAETPAEEEPQKETPEKEEPKEEPKPLEDEPKVERKRSIYDDLKDKKREVKSVLSRAEEAERERDELRAKLEAINGENTPEENDEAEKDVIAYAKKVGANPDLVQRIIEEARQGFKAPEIDEGLKKDLEEFKKWKVQNSQVIEKSMFDEEFKAITPTLKELFPTASSEEMSAVKDELDKLSHTRAMHDKELSYVAFMNRDHLKAFVSPKKRGMEGKGNNEAADDSYEFNPNQDLSKLSGKQLMEWNERYEKLVEAEKGIVTSGKQKMIL